MHLASSHPMCKQLAAHPMASKLGFPISAPPLPLPCALTLPVNAKPVVAKAKQRNSCFLAFPHSSVLGAAAGKTEDVQLLFLRKMGFPAAPAWLFTQHLLPLSRKPALGQFDPNLQQTRRDQCDVFSSVHLTTMHFCHLKI